MKPTTNRDPLLRQIFTEQERLKVSNTRLAKLSGISVAAISELRHPDADKGKRPTLHQVRQLALTLNFDFPDRLLKH